MNQGSLLLIDDDQLILDSMASWLRQQGYAVDEASTYQQAIGRINAFKYDLVLADVRLPDGDGFGILNHINQESPDTIVILLTGYATIETGVDALRAGAFDLVTKPLIDEELAMSIKRALSQREVLVENESLKAQLDQRFGMDSIIGHDGHMQRIFDMIESIADTKATVLITGESGTGKSLIARAIHRHSTRRDKPFVEVACGALPENLLESELFGHVAGSFTGATVNKIGKFKQADTGTIFLDEIGTASPSMQVKLLRILQEFEFEQVGGTETFQVDSRVILATNENLQDAVSDGRFRQDLYYRVNVINIELPALRERPTDVPILAQHFLEKLREQTGKQVDGFTPDAISAMQAYHWPGNVRELENVVERAVLLGKSTSISAADFPNNVISSKPITFAPSSGKTLKEALEGPERQIIIEVLRDNNWNRNATADQLGINRTTLYKKMKRLGLENAQMAGVE